MIYLDRSRIPEPRILSAEALSEELARLRAFYVDQPPSDRAQRRFSPTPVWDKVHDELAELSHGKCAFCESPLGRRLNVEHFRPPANAINLDGLVAREHYWWLVYDWTNLYPICSVCQSRKGYRFPIGGVRAEPEARGEALLAEQPLLLDPCHDDPEQHLVYDPKGMVASTTERGKVTIEVFDLNRDDLQASRRKAWNDVMRDVQALEISLPVSGLLRQHPPSLDLLTDPAKPYTGMRRQIVAQWLQEASPQIRELYTEQELPEATLEVAQLIQQTPSYQDSQEAVKRYYDQQKEQASFSVASQEAQDKRRYYSSFRPIQRIEIRNFKGIEELAVDLRGADDGASVPWLALIGENGTGKSSILQAVALALAGDEYRRELPVRPEQVLRFESDSGSVRVFLAGSPDPIELQFHRGAADFQATPSEPQVLFLGYGATRLLPRAGHEPNPGKPYARTDNLFDPFIPLQDAEEWLGGLDQDDFDAAALAIKDLLSMDDDNGIVRRQNGKQMAISAEIFGDSVPISQLSDGYQSVLALASDIMAVMLERWKAMEIAEGVVLLDEIGSHIHPRWKQRIVKSLRRTFPRIQFLFTTHEPLCIQNCAKGEVHIMSRDAQTKTIEIEQVDIPPGLRTDQVLTGWWFGLATAIDDDTLELLEEHRRLLITPRAERDHARQQTLEEELRNRMGGFADTSTERIALSAAAEVMGTEQPPPSRDERLEIRRKIVERIRSKGG